MGDLRGWSPERNGAVLDEKPVNLTDSISVECWRRAEGVTQEIIAQVQPTVISEDRRKAVIDYVQRLIRTSVGCEVFPFGSVPLKTYLPDGDIDLTAFGGMNIEEALANDVCSVLEREDQNRSSEFIVKDVQLIRAEVKLVKCLVQNIVVDISFNQLGGLCTLCFLEQVDRLIGKDHLFKRSIILIKAWCYYESRILGAHHGLISTYALETLVLYIFHLFHSSLNGPLAVLYKFLDYFSKFDWDNYCISLNGPARISSLPEVVVETPENGKCDLLLSDDFLKDCVEKFSVAARGFETDKRAFPPKHLNIVDPLKENNNLGRSVSKGNFYRIRSAFTYGSRKLGRILSQSEESIVDELSKFFSNTLDRHGSGQRPDVQDSIPIDGQHGLTAMLPLAGTDTYQEDHAIYEPESSNSGNMIGEQRVANDQCLHRGHNKVVGRKTSYCGTVNEEQHSANEPSVSENRLSGDAKDLATSRLQGLSISRDALNSSAPFAEESISPVGKAHHAPHLYFSRSVVGNGEVRDGNLRWKHRESSGLMENKAASGILSSLAEDTLGAVSNCQDEKQLVSYHEVLSPIKSSSYPLLFSSTAWSSEDHYSGHSSNRVSASTPGISETMNTLSDLSGDLENHLYSLHYGRWWCDYAFNTSIPSMSVQLFTPPFSGKNSWDVIRRSVHFRRNVMSQMNLNGSVQRQVYYPMSPPLLPGTSFGAEDMQKPRGTGTYFPNTNHYRDRNFTARGRNQGPVRSPRPNGHIATSHDTNSSERNHRERDLSRAQFLMPQATGRFGSSEFRNAGPHEPKHSPNANGSMYPPERIVEFGSIGHLPPGGSSAQSRQSDPGPEVVPNCIVGQATAGAYQLKDDEDFPPLSDPNGKGSSTCTLKKPEKSEQ